MAIETFASQGEQQGTTHIRMRAQRVHHAIRIAVGITTTEANQVHPLPLEGIYDLAGYVVGALYQVSDHDIVPDSFPSIGTEITLKGNRIT
jgi:uncharacterized membrane protein YkvA (DUF1232 family)